MADYVHLIYGERGGIVHKEYRTDYSDLMVKDLMALYPTPEALEKAVSRKEVVVIQYGRRIVPKVKKTEVITEIDFEDVIFPPRGS